MTATATTFNGSDLVAGVGRTTALASPVSDTASRAVPVTASGERLPDGGVR